MVLVHYKICKNNINNNSHSLLPSLSKVYIFLSIYFDSISNMGADGSCACTLKSRASHLKNDQNPKNMYRQPEHRNSHNS